jgi:prevent-host-death family protein
MSKNAIKEPTIIALKDLRLNTQRYLDAVQKGESFVVVKRSRPAFRMEPIEEQWETVADYTDLPGGGLPIDDFIGRLEKLDGQDR